MDLSAEAPAASYEILKLLVIGIRKIITRVVDGAVDNAPVDI